MVYVASCIWSDHIGRVFFHFYKYELHFWAHIPLKFGIQSEVWKSYFQIDIYLSLWQRLRSFTKPFSSLKDNFLKWMMFDVLKLVSNKIEFECFSVFSAASVAAGAINLRSWGKLQNQTHALKSLQSFAFIHYKSKICPRIVGGKTYGSRSKSKHTFKPLISLISDSCQVYWEV